VGHVAGMGKMINAHILVGKPVWKRQCKWEENIKMDLK
jgi:hypothetical protein